MARNEQARHAGESGSGFTVGVLALQGGFERHRGCLERLGVRVRLVRTPADLQAIDALVIPGGESTAMLTLAGDRGLDALRRFVRERPTFGTCAGAILLARAVDDPPQPAVGALDISIRRNAYGRQPQSSIRLGMLGDSPLEMVFIRAPRIERVGPGVEVLAREGGDPVLVRQGHVMAATFHPELGDDTRVHQIFLETARNPFIDRLSARQA
ncbi:MAG: glutamine amidotransferase subunit PdxT [Acidobacteria bacterium RIFCSPLOWO2_02_FULL_65_29]|nr:MAG: glutamine amidotransferase subunit PdxT [Acidobacteria bacterium RIFCSPLOWO2_02_FULL_65_29]